MTRTTLLAAAALLAAPAFAQSWQPPAPEQRCPSNWGAADERGAANHMSPANVLRASLGLPSLR